MITLKSPKDNHTIINLLLAGLVVIIFFVANIGVGGPIIHADEGSYLSNAAVLTGHLIDQPTDYHAGYSLLISPAFLIGNSPSSVFAYVKLINSVLWGLSFLLLVSLITHLFPQENYYAILTACGVAILYPAWVTISGYSFSESGFVFSFMLVLIALSNVARFGKVNWIFLALALSFLYAIHPKSLPVIVIASFFGLILCIKKKAWAYYFLFALITLTLIFSYDKLFTPWFFQLMKIGDYPPDLHYPSVGAALKGIFTFERIKSSIAIIAGHFFYSIIGSLGLVVFGVLGIGEKLIRKFGKPFLDIVEDNELFIFLFTSLSYIATLLMSAFIFNGGDLRLDHWIYGRYAEGVLLPLLAIGFLFITRKRIIYAAVLSGFSVVILKLSIGTYQNAIPINIPAFWQYLVVPKWFPLGWWLLGVIPLIGLFFIKNNYRRAIIIILVFLGSSFLQIRWHQDGYNGPGQRQSLANLIFDKWLPGTCIGYDGSYPETSYQEVFRYNYGFYLYQYKYERVKPETWYTSCNGPLISFSKDLDEQLPGVSIVGIENYGGPNLWVKGNSEGMKDLYNSLLDWTNVNPQSTITSVILREGWSYLEPAFVWSSQKATIVIDPEYFPEGTYPTQFEMEISAFGASSSRQVDLSIQSNSSALQVSFVDSTIKNVVVPIDPGSNLGDIKIELFIPQAISPSELIGSNDTRILGIALHRFRLSN